MNSSADFLVNGDESLAPPETLPLNVDHDKDAAIMFQKSGVIEKK